MRARFLIPAIGFQLCLLMTGCEPVPTDQASEPFGATDGVHAFSGVWSDSYDDFAFSINMDKQTPRISDATFSRWKSTFADVSVKAQQLAFTQSSVLKSGEYHPVNETAWNATITIDDNDRDVAMLKTVSTSGELLGTVKLFRRDATYKPPEKAR